MGMFDTVIFKCKNEDCTGILQAQSKSGKCDLYTFNRKEVPLAVSADLIDSCITCSACNTKYFIRSKVQTVELKLVRYAE